MAFSWAMPAEQTNHRETVAAYDQRVSSRSSRIDPVFVPLDYLLRGDQLGPHFWPETIAVATVSVLLFVFGVVVNEETND